MGSRHFGKVSLRIPVPFLTPSFPQSMGSHNYQRPTPICALIPILLLLLEFVNFFSSVMMTCYFFPVILSAAREITDWPFILSLKPPASSVTYSDSVEVKYLPVASLTQALSLGALCFHFASKN